MFILLLISFLFFPNLVFATEPIVKITDFSSNSNPEWVQLTNTTDQEISLEGWVFKDEKDNTRNIDICLSPNSNQILEYTYGWLNDTGGDTIFLYNSNQELIDSLQYSSGVDKSSPSSTSTCLITTPIPTADPTITNPDSGVNLTEFMPYTSYEWIEIYNQNDFAVKLVGWQIKDIDLHTKDIPDLTIEANSFSIFEFRLFLNDSQSDKVILYNHNQNIVDSYQYEDDYYSSSRSWSKVDGNWCQADISKGQNNNSCIPTPTDSPPTATPTPTNTPIPTPTPTPDLNRYQAPTGNTPSVIMVPTSQENSPTPTPNPTLVPSSEGIVLGIDDNQSPKKNYLPLILIISGGLLLITPVIITKLKK